MKTKKYNIFSFVSLLIVAIYFIGNSIVYRLGSIFSGLALEIYIAISNVFLMIDLCTWHIYSFFCGNKLYR